MAAAEESTEDRDLRGAREEDEFFQVKAPASLDAFPKTAWFYCTAPLSLRQKIRYDMNIAKIYYLLTKIYKKKYNCRRARGAIKIIRNRLLRQPSEDYS